MPNPNENIKTTDDTKRLERIDKKPFVDHPQMRYSYPFTYLFRFLKRMLMSSRIIIIELKYR
jgi:hypothetical protein